MSFYDSFACQSRAHCETCRALTTAGAQFRRSVKMVHKTESESFPCVPLGLPWGPMPVDDEAVTEERRRLAAGGCCGAPQRNE
jgi:hypothetical protein